MDALTYISMLQNDNYRDVAFIGDLQDGVKTLVRLLGWEKDLSQLMNN